MNNLIIPKVLISEKTLAKVVFNETEIVEAIESAINAAENELVTVETIPYIKKQMSAMNKLIESLKRTRIDTVKAVLVNIVPFENKLKELSIKTVYARTKLDEQVKWFETIEQAYKYDIALDLIEQTKHEIELNEKYTDMLLVKDDYLLSASNPTKTKKLILEHFKELKALQNMDELKLSTVNIIIDAHNGKLDHKFSFDDFVYLLDRDVNEIAEIVNSKVLYRVQEEKETRERIEKEKLEAIAKAKKEAAAEADRKIKLAAEKAEQKRLSDITAVELEKQRAIKKANLEKTMAVAQAETNARVFQQEKIEAIQGIAETVEKIVPIEETEEVNTVSFTFKITASQAKIESLKNYLGEYNFNYVQSF